MSLTPLQRYYGLWRFNIGEGSNKHWLADDSEQRQFGRFVDMIYFPLWYPALIFALGGVGVLRFRRQLSIRLALVCLTVAAALLGMAMKL